MEVVSRVKSDHIKPDFLRILFCRIIDPKTGCHFSACALIPEVFFIDRLSFPYPFEEAK